MKNCLFGENVLTTTLLFKLSIRDSEAHLRERDKLRDLKNQKVV